MTAIVGICRDNKVPVPLRSGVQILSEIEQLGPQKVWFVTYIML